METWESHKECSVGVELCLYDAELKFEAVGDTAVHYCLSTHQGPSTHCKHGCFFMVTIFAAIAN